MIMRKIFLCLMPYVLCLYIGAANALTMFSTSVDWEAITGLRLHEYQIVFGRDRTTSSIGTELYFLDGFPCFGQAEAIRAWISPSNNFAWDENARMRVVCAFVPETIQLAWREVRTGVGQGRTTGILYCPTNVQGRRIQVRLDECTQGKEWREMR
jgi:hypothetical protein